VLARAPEAMSPEQLALALKIHIMKKVMFRVAVIDYFKRLPLKKFALSGNQMLQTNPVYR
jgi:hypothetical protein